MGHRGAMHLIQLDLLGSRSCRLFDSGSLWKFVVIRNAFCQQIAHYHMLHQMMVIHIVFCVQKSGSCNWMQKAAFDNQLLSFSTDRMQGSPFSQTVTICFGVQCDNSTNFSFDNLIHNLTCQVVPKVSPRHISLIIHELFPLCIRPCSLVQLRKERIVLITQSTFELRLLHILELQLILRQNSSLAGQLQNQSAWNPSGCNSLKTHL